jgi:membrane-bound lytic murein transglycosylase MltF
MTDQETYQLLIRAECEKRKLPDFKILCAIAEHESSWNPWAIRYEPMATYQVAVDDCARLNGITIATEKTAQKFSFGLGQIMGATARWMGYRRLLTELCDPHTGIYWMCEAYAKLGDKYEKIEEKIAAYNAGSAKLTDAGLLINQSYVDSVLKLYRSKNYG